MLKYYYEKQHDNILYTTTPNTTNIYSKRKNTKKYGVIKRYSALIINDE